MYNKEPETKILEYKLAINKYTDIVKEIKNKIKGHSQNYKICFECYPGTDYNELLNEVVKPLNPNNIVFSDDYAVSRSELNSIICREMTDDRVFGRMTFYNVSDFYPKISVVKNKISEQKGLTVVFGTGASLLVPNAEILIYCDLARWEIQCRYRKGMGNWLQGNENIDPLRKFKRGYFFDWRIADRLKKKVLPTSDYFLDMNSKGNPKMVDTQDLLMGLKLLEDRPYRTVPYFDESVWGGQWMKVNFDLPKEKKNYGWAFDGVPEENSLYFRFGNVRVEVPAIDLMLFNPRKILGEKVFSRFGAEFPIRFDLLDTVEGGNLSLQVHPLTEFIKQHYGMSYTQDESYYILDATDDATVYIGQKNNISKSDFIKDISTAESNNSFNAEKYINKIPAKKGDHFLIPAGTVHCGGSGTLILEVSATPYIFTFKMWDWGRVGLDGKPRPLHVKEGLENIQWNRDLKFVTKNLYNNITKLKNNPNEKVEKTGLAEKTEFIETQRHIIHTEGDFSNHGSVNMLNMVHGDTAIVESINGKFEPFEIHFGETFIVPAKVEEYRIKNLTQHDDIVIIQAFVK